MSSFELFDIYPPVHTCARERLRKEGFLEIQRENKQRKYRKYITWKTIVIERIEGENKKEGESGR